MKICIVGAGAMGGLMGIKLASAGEDVTFVDREGPHLRAIQRDGLKVLTTDGEQLVAPDVMATHQLDSVGLQDLVILAVKAHQIPHVAAKMRPLLGPDTMVVTIQNGIPWWYFCKYGGQYEGMRIKAVDPAGDLHAKIEPERIIGCVAYPAAEVIEPGVIKHVEGNRFPVGELDGLPSERVETVSQTFNKAGLKSFVLDDIRSEIWLKAWGTLSLNPISALTGATLIDMCDFPLTRELAASMMAEAQTVAEKLNVQFRHTIDRRIAGAARVGKHKTSMLQDVEARRELEVDALVGAVVELGRLTDTPTPHISAVYACVKLLDEMIQKEDRDVGPRMHRRD